MSIERFLLIILFIYVIYLHSKINKNKNIEKFAVTDDIIAAVKQVYGTDMEAVRKLTPVYDIKTAVKEIYNTDMEAVRQLAKMAEDLRTGGVKIPGNLIVTGTITSTGDISSASYSLSGLNTSIGTINTALTATEKTLTTNLTAAVKAINTDLDKKISNDSNVTLGVVSARGVNYPNHKLFKRSSDGLVGTWDGTDWTTVNQWTISTV